MSLNYGTLKTKILDDAHRPDLGDAKAVDFVRFAEGEIARRLRATEMIKRSTLTDGERVTAGFGIYTLPTDYLEERVVRRADGLKLDKESLSGLRNFDGGTALLSYAPISKTEIEFRGVPSVTETIELTYFARPATFTLDPDVNLLLTDHESLYVDAGLQALYIFTQDRELASDHAGLALDTIETLNEQAGRLLGGAETDPGYCLSRSGSY